LGHKPASLGLTLVGFHGHFAGHDHFAVVEFQEAGVEVLAPEGSHARFVFFLSGHLGGRFGGGLLRGNSAGEVLLGWFVGLSRGKDFSRDR
jgi:hypothetical protein